MDERIRVVVAGPGPADEDRLAVALARALRDAGMEVVYTDRPHTPEQLLATVVQEDADAVGLTVPAGGDAAPVTELARLMQDRGIDDVVVFAGGLAGDRPGSLSGHGVAQVFPPDVDPGDVARWVRARLGS